ncbi:MAG TPA: succinate dehydrogenase/fumarate reductase flavoprotein subunit, partial [Thermohalobaculum sp.]|nr:succinate dehydrogenase/fumarate reductase flavoprotein subunit [Thermohalobaculum sp.]
GIERGLERVGDLAAEVAQTGLPDGERRFNLTWHDWMNMESLIATSEVIARAALAREDSRGAHFREDFPETGDLETTAYTRLRQDGDRLALEMVPVAFDIVRPGESLIEGEVGAPKAQ